MAKAYTRQGIPIQRWQPKPYKGAATDLRVHFTVKDNTPKVKAAYKKGEGLYLKELGKLIVYEAKRQATIDPKVRTGRLWRSIGYTYHGYPDARIEVGATAYYGFFLEFGTVRMNRPHPFLRPAYLRVRPAMAPLAMRWLPRYVEKVK